jgi:hypothetical protein
MKTERAWPLGITLAYSFFSVGMIGTAIFISSTHFDLESPDYYEQELVFQDQLDRLQRTVALPEQPAIELAGAKQLHIRFPESLRSKVERLTLSCFRPSDASKDFRQPLILDSEGQSTLAFAPIPGLWKARLSWEMNGEEYYLEEVIIVPKA